MLCGLGALLGLALSSLISWWLLGADQCMVYRPDGCVLGVAFCRTSQSFGSAMEYCDWEYDCSRNWGDLRTLYFQLNEAFSVAVALSIILMMTTDSLHPPSGAVAITRSVGR